MRSILITLAFLAIFAAGGAARAAILFDGRMESGVIYPLTHGTVDSFYYGAMSAGCTWTNSVPNNRTYSTSNNNRLVTSPVRHGTYANAQTVFRNCDYRSYNSNIYQKPRQELGVTDSSFSAQHNTEYWYGFSFMIPSDFVPETNANAVMSLFQQKQNDSDAGTKTGISSSCCVFDLSLDRSTFKFKVDGLYTAGSTVGSPVFATDNEYSWPLEQGVWWDVQINFKLCNLAEKAAGCTPFVRLYVNREGQTNATPVKTWENQANTTSAGAVGGPKLNVYRYSYNCTIAGPDYEGQQSNAQADFEFCKTNPNPTNNPVSTTVYFDELLIGDATSSLAEIAPHVFDTPSNPPPIKSVTGHNQQQPVENNDDPVFFTVSNSTAHLGVRSVRVCRQGSATECDDMVAVNSNQGGGRYTANAFPSITGDGNIPVTVTWTYDQDPARKVLDSEVGPAITSIGGGSSNWAAYSITSPPAAVSRGAAVDYGYVNGGEICNSTQGVRGYHNSPTFSVAGGDVIEIRTTLDTGTGAQGTGDTGLVQLYCTTAGTTSYGGTLGAFAPVTQNVGETAGIFFDQKSHSGVFSQLIRLTFNTETDAATDTCRVRIGPNTTTQNHCVIGLGARVWKNPASDTLTYNTTLARPDTTAPLLSECNISWNSTTAQATVGCNANEPVTLKPIITYSDTVPNLAQVLAGNGADGNPAPWAGTVAITGTSGSTVTTALDPFSPKYAWFVGTDAAGLNSVVVAADDFIPADSPPVNVNLIKFHSAGKRIQSLIWDAGLNRWVSGYFTGTLEFFEVHAADPRIPGNNDAPLILGENVLSGETNTLQVTAGEITLDQADINACAPTCFGAFASLQPETDYWMSYRLSDGNHGFVTVRITQEAAQ